MLLLLGWSASAQAGGLSLNGVGGRANAMGGAFVGDASDLSAVYWNPAGLTQLGSRQITLGAGAVLPSGTYRFPTYGVEAEMDSVVYPNGLLGYAQPLNERLVLGVFACVPSGAGARWKPSGLAPLSLGEGFSWDSQIGVAVVSPAVAYRFDSGLSVGATLNLNVGLLRLESPAVLATDAVAIARQYEESHTGWGIGGSLGLRYAPNDRVSFGATWRLPAKVSFSGDATNPLAPIVGAGLGLSLPETSGIEREITWPSWVGVGVSAKPREGWTVNADVHYSNWGQLETLGATFDDPTWEQLFVEGATFGLNWSDRLQWRLGAEWQASPSLALRAGYYYDPSPTPPKSLNILLPSADFHGLSAGIGIRRGNSSFDVCLETMLSGAQQSPVSVDSAMPGEHHYKRILLPQIVFTQRFGD